MEGHKIRWGYPFVRHQRKLNVKNMPLTCRVSNRGASFALPLPAILSTPHEPPSELSMYWLTEVSRHYSTRYHALQLNPQRPPLLVSVVSDPLHILMTRPCRPPLYLTNYPTPGRSPHLSLPPFLYCIKPHPANNDCIPRSNSRQASYRSRRSPSAYHQDRWLHILRLTWQHSPRVSCCPVMC